MADEITVTILRDDWAALVGAFIETRDVCGSPEPCDAPDCVRLARLAAARDLAERSSGE